MSALPPELLTVCTDSFTELGRRLIPDALPGPVPEGEGAPQVPTGTTILALTTADGVLMAGDRRATMGNVIASHTIEKVHPADDASVIGIAGTAGLALDLIHLFQVELEHYEKISGTPLSLLGKANRLATMLRGRLDLALRGLAVVPLFAGVDPSDTANPGRIYSFDVTGGSYPEGPFHSIGSGAAWARGTLDRLWRPALDLDAGVDLALEALIDAAGQDSATGGPDPLGRIAPTVLHATVTGVQRVPPARVLERAQAIMESRGRRNGR
ncbi:proteasome subunit beta [Brevibacterium sp. 50QC2O2]|uniref:proteasome subunit beta n=1 Tax=Brevibacterium sp. 50QC2O2 TaxID=2968459 RepID=UPI00211C7697|nr:proteasome subunit beta [Brevibacterium sp. 50QC2O2]